MSYSWDDDERSVLVRSYVNSKVDSNDDYQSVCDIMRDFFKSQRESQYTWTYEDHAKEVRKRLNHVKLSSRLFAHTSSPVSNEQESETPPPSQVDTLESPDQADADEEDDAEELNDDILEKEIYKKSLYS